MKLLSNYLRGTPARPPITPARIEQCTKTTKAGNRCKLPAVLDTGRCALPAHAPGKP